MPRDPRFDVLFEPVRIGPVTARNRFYQVPHCNGMGSVYPSSMAAMRATKAEGGWGVVCTEETDFHPSSDITPYIEGRLWDAKDIPVFARMTEAVHEHGSLAGIELNHTGHRDANIYSREVPLSSSHWPCVEYPAQARAMDKTDIRAFRRWHRAAVQRAQQAGFDIIYVYLRPGGSMPGHFLSRRLNRRSDEYGGSLENRARLFHEMLSDAIDAVGDQCAIAVRLTVDSAGMLEGVPDTSEGREVLELFAELPDLWDVNIAEWRRDSMPSRFGPQGWQEDIVAFVKGMTTKPVVGVGRFTSPDMMVSQVRRGVLDFIGAARPSIADPFLPNKIREGRVEDIRECIGCNICIAGEFTIAPMRCTQNPTVGEEWRKGWHPERLPAKQSNTPVLVVGAGPAGLECTRALGERGYSVTLAEARDELGGRVARESRLPGLAEWGRVRDYRVYQVEQMANVDVYKQSPLTAEQVQEFGAGHVVLATGAEWRRDGLGREHKTPVERLGNIAVLTPDDVLDGAGIAGPVVVYDDDHYYMGSVVAESLVRAGLEVSIVTPAAEVAQWSHKTLEQTFVEQRLHELGVRIIEKHRLEFVRNGQLHLSHVISHRPMTLACVSLVLVTMRLPSDALYHELMEEPTRIEAAGIKSITRIGDCLAPGIIAAAVYSGHRQARELEQTATDHVMFERELPELGDFDPRACS